MAGFLDGRRSPPTIYENVDVALARQYRDQVREAASGIDGAVPAITDARDAALADIDTSKDEAQTQIASDGAVQVALAADQAARAEVAASSAVSSPTAVQARNAQDVSQWAKAAYVDGSPLSSATARASPGWAYDCPADVPAGRVIDAVAAELTYGVTATKTRVRVWSVATADGNVNSAPPQANDVLLSDVTFADLSTLQTLGGVAGASLNSTSKMNVYPLTVPVLTVTGQTYKILIEALDGSDALVAVQPSIRTVASTGRQRRSGWDKATAAAGSYSNRLQTTIVAGGLLTKSLSKAAVSDASISSNASEIKALSKARVARQNIMTETALLTQSALFGKALTGTFGLAGDSQINNTDGDTAFVPVDILDDYITPSGGFSMLAVRGTRTDQIRLVALAQTADWRNHGVQNGGTNNFGGGSGARTSGVSALTIGAAGSGGTDGVYPLVFSGGAPVSGSNAAIGTVTVSGGVATAVSLTYRGGGYTTVPSVTATVPGMTGMSLVAAIDVMATFKIDMTEIMAVSGPAKVLLVPMVVSDPRTPALAWEREAAAWEKASFGARVLDGKQIFARHHNGTEADLVSVRAGIIAPSISVDSGLHPTPGGRIPLYREVAMLSRALEGLGGPYIHDDEGAVTNQMALGSTVFTPRAAGSPVAWSIIEGNDGVNADAVRISSSGVITRGAGVLAPGPIELLLSAQDAKGKGSSNAARIVLHNQMDGTIPQSIVRLKGIGSQVMWSAGLTGAVPTKKMTVVMLARLRDTTSTSCVFSRSRTGQNPNSPQVRKVGRIVNFSPTPPDSGTNIVSVNTPNATAMLDWNLWAMTIDTTTGVQIAKASVSEDGTNTAVPTADALIGHNLLHTIVQSSGSSGLPSLLPDFDIKFLWVSDNYLDVADPAVRSLFYDPATKLARDLGASGVVSGIAPLIYLCGKSGDYGRGKNRGSGGDFYMAPYIDRENYGFEDVAS